ncbi:unnamed protein product, partial [Durusdinium trenchii]
ALSEAPLVCVSMDESRACSVILEMEDSWEALLGYPALLYWAALQTLTESEVNGAFQGGVSLEVQELALQLWAPLRETELSEGVTTVLKSLWREPVRGLALKVERLLKIWVFNSLRCGEWVILPLLTAMCSHDCSPNAFWNFDLEQKIIELRAGEHIQQGMELKISYLSSGVLWLPVLERRHRLEITKEFVCTCERCSNQWDDARVFVCPRCQGDAFATPKATCVGAEGVEGTEGAEGAERGWWKLKGAVVELCSEEEEPAACVACASCGPLSCVEAASFLVPEKDLAELLLRTPQLATALAGDSILEEVCLSQEALLLLWQAEKCGLASRHWVVDALRAFAAEEEPAQCLLFTLARLKAISRAPGAPANSAARLKAARLQVLLWKAREKQKRARPIQAEDEDFPAEATEWKTFRWEVGG